MKRPPPNQEWLVLSLVSPCPLSVFWGWFETLPSKLLWMESYNQYVSFCVWLLSCDVIFSSSVYGIVCFSGFLWPNKIPLYACTFVYTFWKIHSSTNGPLGCLRLFAIMGHVAMSLCVSVFVCSFVFSSLECISVPMSGILGSYANSMHNFLRNCWIVFRCGCIMLHSYQPLLEGSDFSTFLPTLCW